MTQIWKRTLVLAGVAFVALAISITLVATGNPGLTSSAPPSFAKTILRTSTLERHADGNDVSASQRLLTTAHSDTVMLHSVTDAEVLQGYPNAGCGQELLFRVGYDDYLDPDGQIVRGLVRFNLVAIPPAATIENAGLELYLVESWDFDEQTRTITTFRVTSPWAEDIVTWNNAPTLAEPYGSASVTHGAWGWYPFDVTDLVRGWHSDAFPNYGIALRGPEHPGSDSSWRGFATGETPYAPRLRVTYAMPVLTPDFDLSVEPSAALISAGESVSYTVTVSSTDGFTGAVTLKAGGLPADTTHTWSTNPVVLAPDRLKLFSTLGISSSTTTPTGTYTLVITGTSELTAHLTMADLHVSADISECYLPLIWKKDTAPLGLPLVHANTRNAGTGAQAVKQGPIDDAAGYALVPYAGGDPQMQNRAISKATDDTVFLLIGVADYLNMELPAAQPRAGAPGYDLSCPLNDTADMRDTYNSCGCIGLSGFPLVGPQAANGCPLSNMLVLNDAQATKAAIQKAITVDLDARETAATTVIIVFSGHGSFGADVAPIDEADGYDEYLAPYDLQCDPCGDTPETTLWDLTTAIRDDELESWLSALESQQVILFLDSCFSAGMIEAGDVKVRSFSSAGTQIMNAVQAGDGMMADLSAAGRIVLTASAADQPSWEFGALKNGVFTYYLVKALQSPTADTNSNGFVSAEEAYAYLAGRVDDYVYGNTGSVPEGPYHQTPQMYDGIAGEVDLTQPVEVTTCP